MDADQQAAATRGLPAWAALGGILYVAFFLTGCWVLFKGVPQGDDPPWVYQTYFGHAGNRDRMTLGWILASVGLLCLLFFIASLHETVSRFGDSVLTTLTTLGGAIYATLALVAFALDSAVKTMNDDTYQGTVHPELIHAADDAAYVIHATGAAALGVMILAASIAFIRSGVVPKWAGWLGIVAALAAFATIAFFPTFVWLLWILVVSSVIFLKGAGTTRESA